MDTTLARPPIGQLLDGRYRVESHLARGGMATVYLGTDTRLERTVALKIMHPEFADDPEFVRRFVAEAKSIARLSHPNVVTVFDQGADGHTLYLAMEYVPGRTLRDLLIERGRLNPTEALEIMEGILAGLGAAHDAGIAHRDVKPENVLLGARAIKVADFGLARLLAESNHTQSGIIIGTAAYLAPEQVAGVRADARTDVYAAGIILFELLTGTQPHVAETPLAVAYKHVNDVVPPPSALMPGLPPAVDRLVAMSTSRDPDLRPDDAGQFMRQVSRTLEGMPDDGTMAVPPSEYDTVPPGGPWTPAGYGPGYPPPAANQTLVVGHVGQVGQAGGPGAGEPQLQRLLFGPRLGFVAALLATVLVVAGVGWWYTVGRYTSVPPVRGMTVAAAKQALKSAGLTVSGTTFRADDTVAKNLVAGTDPSIGTKVPHGGHITVVISAGPTTVTVPQVKGQSVVAAEALLSGDHLTNVTTIQGPALDVRAGLAARTEPSAGTLVPATTPITLVISNGRVPIPNLTGMSLSKAESVLQALGLRPQVHGFHFFSSGVVTGYSPTGSAPPGSTVTLNVQPFGGNSGNSAGNTGTGNNTGTGTGTGTGRGNPTGTGTGTGTGNTGS